MASAGRPTKFSPELQEIICKKIADGATYAEAAEAAGINYFTFLRWRQAGEKQDSGRYCEFCEAIKTAEDQSKQTLLKRIVTAGKDPKFWQANAWILERRFPKEFGRRVNISGENGGPVAVVRDMTDEEIEKRAREIFERRNK